MSEIDDIFATEGKIDPPTHLCSLKKKNKNKNKNKNKKQDVTPTPPVEEPLPARPVPETITDPSAGSHILKRRRKDSESSVSSKRKKVTQEEELFKDSRGTGPRRKTEEGWNVYKADELGLNDEGGDTPLCPFDCECCF